MTQIQIKCISTSETEFSVSLLNGKFCMSTSCAHYEQSLCTVSQRRECHIKNKVINNPPTKLRTVQMILKTILPKTGRTQSKPYPPSFNNTPAKIIKTET